MQQVEDLGGSVRAIEAGFIQGEIEEAAFRFQREVETGKRVVVGVNRFRLDKEDGVPVQELSAETEGARVREVHAYREGRDQTATDEALAALESASQTSENLFPIVLNAFRAGATLGEVCGVLRRAWGEYRG